METLTLVISLRRLKFCSNIFKRLYGSKITAPNYIQKTSSWFKLHRSKQTDIFGEFKNVWLFFFIGGLIKDRSSHQKVVDSFLRWLEIAHYNLNSRIILTLFSSQWQSNIMAKLALQLLTTLSPHTQWGQIQSELKFALSYITLTISQDKFIFSNLYHHQIDVKIFDLPIS